MADSGIYLRMSLPETVVTILLEEPLPSLAEATVRLPPRSTRWVAVFTGDEPGRQIARSTGLTNKAEALALALKWESEARERRAGLSALRKTRIRVPPPGGLTQAQVAALLQISPRTVRAIEKRALRKLRNNPTTHALWAELTR
jgi:DNA-binding XRE family transcriptional regulator